MRASIMRIFGVLMIGFAVLETSARRKGSRLRIEQVTQPRSLSEGPHWDIARQLLFYVDIPGQKMICFNPVTKKVTEAYIKNGPVGVAVPVAGSSDTFIAGSGTDLVKIKWDISRNESDPEIDVLSTVDVDQRNTRFNDGKVDPAGRFWAGTIGQVGEETIYNIATLYRFDADGTPTPVIENVSISNGLCWSHDNQTFYYIDSVTLEVAAYDYDLPSGNISNKRVVFTLQPVNPDEVPDGMTIDKKGNLWIAIHGGGKVLEVNPNTGSILRTIRLPALQTSSVAFGGPNLDILYVTTGKIGLTAAESIAQPLAGSVFAVHGLHDVGAPMLDVLM